MSAPSQAQTDPLFAPADAIDFSGVQRVLVIMLRHHGDVLLTSPVFSVLKQIAPAAEVDALVYADTLPLIAFNPDLTSVHVIDRRWKNQGFWSQLKAELTLLKALRARRFDLIIHLTNHRRGAWLVRLLRPQTSVAPRLRDEPWFWSASFTHRYPSANSVGPGHPLGRRHTVQQHLDALRRLGATIAVPPALTLIAGSGGDQDARDARIAMGLEAPYVLVQPTSRWMFKTWPVEHNVELICGLLDRGQTVLVSCGPDAREQAVVAAIQKMLGNRASQVKWLTAAGTLNRLAALIRDARLFVGIDSAPMHMAAALGTPLIVLFGPSGQDNWGPWTGNRPAVSMVLSSDIACRPCGQDGCGGGKVSECLRAVSVSRVLMACDEVLEQSHAVAAS